jgi:hypothetical protein
MSGERYVNAVVESVTRIGRYMIIKPRPLEGFRYSPGNSIDIFLDPSYCGGGKCFRVFFPSILLHRGSAYGSNYI